jgi:CheY-like chemotaxis protein
MPRILIVDDDDAVLASTKIMLEANGFSGMLVFRWTEHHGPPVTPPRRQGFGTSLLKTVFPDISLGYAIAGFGCEIKTAISGEASPR